MTCFQDTFKVLWFLLFTMGATSFVYTQDEPDYDEIDALLDQVLFSEDEFVDDLLQDAYRYNIIYGSVTYNSNTFYYGRENDIDQFNLTPQVSWSSSLGLVFGVSGVYFGEYEPHWSHTSISAGYFNYIGKKELIRYYGGYSRTFFTDGWDSLTNSIEVVAGLRNKMRTLGIKLDGYYLFGNGQSYQVIAEGYGNFTLLARKKFKIKHRPGLTFIMGQQLWYSYPYRPHEGIQEKQYDGLLNTQINIPIYLVTKSWDLEIGYTLNFPTKFKENDSAGLTGFFNISIGYLIDLSH